MLTRPLSLTVLLASTISAPSFAQSAHVHEHAHVVAAVQPEQLGNVHFPVSCDAAAQKQFDRAIALLHTFWYPEARKAFEKVLQEDAECAIAYWGVAMTHYHPLWEIPDRASLRAGWEAIQKAEALDPKTERERDYVAALKTFYQGSAEVDHRPRAVAYENAMERLAARYPQDSEAAIFHALSLLGTAPATDKSYANQIKAGRILEEHFKHNPDHPGIAHYIIHAYDYPDLAERAVAAAKHYAKVAPEVPHVLHMPSHIFTRLGLWQDSVESNLNVIAASRKYSERVTPGAAYFEELHGADYLAYAYLQQAQDRNAKGVVNHLAQIRSVEPPNFAAAFAFTAVPARYALERRAWSEAASLDLHPQGFPWDQHAEATATIHFARAVGAARSGATEGARREVEELARLRERLKQEKDEYWADQVEIQRRAAAAWLAYGEGKDTEALEVMRSAAELEDATEKHPVTPGAVLPAREMLGDLLLELGRPAEALLQYEAVLKSSPNRFNALSGAAKAARAAGDHAKARTHYQLLLKVAANADADRPALREARQFVNAG